MKKQSHPTLKAQIMQGLPYLLLLISGTVLAVFTPETTRKVSHSATGLTFAERVSYQRAIEEVYWRHRIWPKENPNPKPPLDAVMSRRQLEKKVEGYLITSKALEDNSSEPLSADQLQSEMERMARDSKQPEVLRELFQALGNDPFVIAECLARPVLTERLAKSGEVSHVGSKAAAPSLTPKLIAAATAGYTLPRVKGGGNGCTDDTWTPTSLTNAPDGRQSHKAVWTGTEMIIWGGGVADNNDFNTGGRYNPSTDSWTSTSIVNAPEPRVGHTAIWTGTEMIVWGGVHCCPLVYFNDGGRYNPSTDTWAPTSTTGAPDGRSSHTAVWTGSEMILWGGFSGSTALSKTGGRYDPTTDSWTATRTTNAPSGRLDHTAVWTGSEMIVWGGSDLYNQFDSGGRYNPVTDTWMATSTTNVPEGRESHTAVWNGTEMIIWGGASIQGSTAHYVNTGGKYNPFIDSWNPTSTVNAPDGRDLHTAVWTGSEMLVWGGSFYEGGNYHYFNTGGRYDPFTDTWVTTSTANAPSARNGHAAVWTGTEMIIWGGFFYEPGGQFQFFNNGGRYCAETGPTPTPTPVPIILYAEGKKVQGINTVRLTWSAANSANVDIDRNGETITTTPNDGLYVDSTGNGNQADYTYKVCETGGQICSNEARVSFEQTVSATWSSNPVSGDWNNPLNWTPNMVPNGPTDTATFNSSSITNVSLSGDIEVEKLVFNPGASSFTITCPKKLTLSGTGITNNSGITQNFIANAQYVPILFTHSATAGSATVFTNDKGYIEFDDTSTAGSATFVTDGKGVFDGAITIFQDNSTCGTATFTNVNGGVTFPTNGADATFINNAGGETYLYLEDRAVNATMIANSGGTVDFDSGSRGDNARIEIFAGGYLYLPNAYEIGFGSIEGDGLIETGDTEVTVGSNNLSTAFGGLIQDKVTEGNGGKIIKVGTGTFRLTSANTYRNGTVVSDGTLIVANTSGSATGVGSVSANGGILAGHGIIAGKTTIGSGSGLGGSLQPGKGGSNPATLTLQKTLTFKNDGTYTWKLNTKKVKADQVIASGVTIESGAQFDFNVVGNQHLTVGTVFSAISNTATTAISGTFANLADGSIVTIGVNNLQVSYSGGDGNDLTLTAVP